jgi:hypothetical protein
MDDRVVRREASPEQTDRSPQPDELLELLAGMTVERAAKQTIKGMPPLTREPAPSEG